jgi:hypothetical protein
MSNTNDNDITTKLGQSAKSNWAQIMGEIAEKLIGTNMSTTIAFDDLEVDVPHAKGPDGSDLGSAKWIINGKITWTTTTTRKE